MYRTHTYTHTILHMLLWCIWNDDPRRRFNLIAIDENKNITVKLWPFPADGYGGGIFSIIICMIYFEQSTKRVKKDVYRLKIVSFSESIGFLLLIVALICFHSVSWNKIYGTHIQLNSIQTSFSDSIASFSFPML